MFRVFVICMVAAVCSICSAASAAWMTNLREAGEVAKKENKYILVEFTGSDWCRYCIIQKKTVLDTPEFCAWLAKHCVPVEIDVPHDATLVGGEQQKLENYRICEEYQVNRFPTVLLLSPHGALIGGYHGAQPTAAAAIAALEKLFPDGEKMAAAMKKNGAERALSLKQIYDSQTEKVRKGNFRLLELVALADEGDTTGVKKEYTARKQMKLLTAALDKADSDEKKLEAIEKTLAEANDINRAEILKIKEVLLREMGFRLYRSPQSVEDIIRSRDLTLRAIECVTDAKARETQLQQARAFYADPEALYRARTGKKKE